MVSKNISFILIILFLTNFVNSKSNSAVKIGLALSGGGARGIAHIGVLRRLEEEHIEPYIIAGSSMGGLVGSLYALGYNSYEIENIFKKNDLQEDILNNKVKRDIIDNYMKTSSDRTILELNITKEGIQIPNSLSDGSVVSEKLSEVIASSIYKSTNFDSLKCKLRIICSDIQSAKKVVFKEGDLVYIISGTICFPALFKPVKYKNMKLMDGGLTDNLPSDELEDSDIKILSNTTYDTPSISKNYSFLQILDRISITMTNNGVEANKKLADILIEPKFTDIPLDNFKMIDSLIMTGYKETEKIIPKLKELIRERELNIAKTKVLEYPNDFNFKFKGNAYFADSILVDSCFMDYDGNKDYLSEIRKNILTFYNKRGYVLSNASIVKNQDTLFINIDEGLLKKIEIDGNKATSNEFLKTLLKLKTNSVLTLKQANKNLYNLKSTGLFSKTTYQINNESNTITYKLEEKQNNLLRMGANYQTDRSFKGLFEYTNTNVNGSGAKFRSSFIYGDKFNYVELSYYDIFRPLGWFYEFQGHYSRIDYDLYKFEKKSDMYSDERYGVCLNTGFQFFKNYQLLIKSKLEGIKIDDADFIYNQTETGQVKIDNRDHQLFATKGTFISLNFVRGMNGDKMDNLNNSYHKLYGNLNYYFTPLNNLSLFMETKGGLCGNLTPLSEKFKLGGKIFIAGSIADEIIAEKFMSFKFGTRTMFYKDQYVKLYYTLTYNVSGFWKNTKDIIREQDLINSFYMSFAIDTPIIPGEIGFGFTQGNRFYEKFTRVYLLLGYPF